MPQYSTWSPDTTRTAVSRKQLQSLSSLQEEEEDTAEEDRYHSRSSNSRRCTDTTTVNHHDSDSGHQDEKKRCEALERYQVLNTEPERDFDDIARLAGKLCGCPIAAITFVDTINQVVFFKAQVGLSLTHTKEVHHTFCSVTVQSDNVHVVNDAQNNDRWRCSPFVTESPGIKFYAGAPLISSDGYRLGALCVMDTIPKALDEFQLETLQIMSRQVVSQLESKVHLRDLLTAQASLVSKNQELEKLNADKSKLIGVMTHDIRQPLSNILVAAELLMNSHEEGEEEETTDDTLSEEAMNLVNTIHSSASFAHVLVDELLEMTKSDFGCLCVDVELKTTNMTRLLSSIVNQNLLYARRKSIDLKFDIKLKNGTLVSHGEWLSLGEEPILCRVDVNKMEQVMNNMISNAVKFSHSRTTIRVILEENPDNVTILIQDQGQGIPPDELHTLFQPWQRCSVKPTAGETSTGLGLAIVKNIVHAHQGHIRVESEIGIGTTFLIHLPHSNEVTHSHVVINHVDGEVTVQAPPQEAKASPSIIPDLQHMFHNKDKDKLRILCADDNMISQKLISGIFRKRGCDVVLASDGQEALELFELHGGHSCFDILLVDGEMPRMSGLDVVRAIRQMESKDSSLGRIPIISISGHISDNFTLLKEAGADGCYTKPFNVGKLVQLVDSFICVHNRARLEQSKNNKKE